MTDRAPAGRRRLGMPSASMLVALLALFAALGGSAVAVKKATINGATIKKGTIAPSKIKPNSLTGAQIKEAALAKVPSATRADSAAAADTATRASTADSAAALEGVPAASFVSGVITTSENGPACSVANNTLGTCTAVCPIGSVALGGGGSTVADNTNGRLIESYPSTSTGAIYSGSGAAPAWTVRIFNLSGGSPTTIRTFVVCGKTS